MVNDFARVLRDKIQQEMHNHAADIARGTCRSFDEYQKLCGVIRGLALAEDYLLALLEKVQDSDE